MIPEAKENTNLSPPTQRLERKFFILPRNIGFAYTLLRQICRADTEYPEGKVNSLYFDTTDLDEYLKSESGDFSKDKVRIRWYDETEKLNGMVPVFLELKSRQGFASSKQRMQFNIPAYLLKKVNLGKGIIDKTKLIDTLAEFGYFHEKSLRPIIKVSYYRYRFNEIFTGTRVSLDYNICSTMIAPDLGFRERELKLPGGVIEVKGQKMELPETLRKIKLLDTDWSRFSKYSLSIDAHLNEPGSVARLWPSGRMIEP
jgi:hypothetical protein